VVLLALVTVLGIRAWQDLGDRAAQPTLAAGAGGTSAARPTPTAGAPPAAPAYGAQVSIDLGGTNKEDGMVQFEFEDGQTLAKTVGGREARATAHNPSTGRYIYFNIDDAFLYAKDSVVAVTVTYFDQGGFEFWIDYDSTDLKATEGGIWKQTPTPNRLTGSQQWMTATFVLPDAFFGGRQHDDADFRIGVGNAMLYVDGVTVTNLSLPPVVGPGPSERVAAFYYPWYGSADIDGEWVHWQEPDFQPPSDISSDYYPKLGAYSSVDPAAVAQHFAWLRESGVGLIIASWWGQGSPTDQAVPLLLELGSLYDVKVAFHIEPYAERSADQLAGCPYLYARYGAHPASTARPRPAPGFKATGRKDCSTCLLPAMPARLSLMRRPNTGGKRWTPSTPCPTVESSSPRPPIAPGSSGPTSTGCTTTSRPILGRRTSSTGHAAFAAEPGMSPV
jgi:hypothetical protein